jgi:hypothetical protein
MTLLVSRVSCSRGFLATTGQPEASRTAADQPPKPQLSSGSNGSEAIPDHRQPAELNATIRSVGWCSASTWSAPDGSDLLTLGASSIPLGPEGSRRIVWMIKWMIKQGRQVDDMAAADLDAAVDPPPPTW